MGNLNDLFDQELQEKTVDALIDAIEAERQRTGYDDARITPRWVKPGSEITRGTMFALNPDSTLLIVYNEDGHRIAEFDIPARGKPGFFTAYAST